VLPSIQKSLVINCLSVSYGFLFLSFYFPFILLFSSEAEKDLDFMYFFDDFYLENLRKLDIVWF
jgi:hypothetical protein